MAWVCRITRTRVDLQELEEAKAAVWWTGATSMEKEERAMEKGTVEGETNSPQPVDLAELIGSRS